MDDSRIALDAQANAEARLEGLMKGFSSYVEATLTDYIDRTGGKAISATEIVTKVLDSAKSQMFLRGIEGARDELLRVGGSLGRYAIVSGPARAFNVFGLKEAYENDGIGGVLVEAGRIAASGLGSAAGAAAASAALVVVASAPAWLIAAAAGAIIVGGGAAGVFIYDVLAGKRSIVSPGIPWDMEEWDGLRVDNTSTLEVIGGTDWSRRAVWDTEAGTVEISAPTKEFELAMVRSVLSRDDIVSVTLNGERFAMDSVIATDTLAIRNSIDSIADQSYETAEIILKEGDQLNVGGIEPHTVQSGDTRESLSSQFGLAPKELVAQNTWLVDAGRVRFLNQQVLLLDGQTLDRSEELEHSLTGSNNGDYLVDLNGGDDALFGGAGNNELRGGIGDDGLYGGIASDLLVGGGGSDTLLGAPGNDRLVGGANELEDDLSSDILNGGLGFDSYWVGKGDFVTDADGIGEIYLGENVLTGGASADGDTYVSEDGSIVYRYQTGSLLINDSIKVAGFQNGQLGISLTRLDGTDADFSIPDYQVTPQDPPYGTQFPTAEEVADYGYYGILGWQSPNAISGDTHDETIHATGLQEHSGYTVAGGPGNTRLEGDAGFNWLVDDAAYASDGQLINVGTAVGNDTLLGKGGEDWLFGHGGNDWLMGGEGDDLLIDNPDSVWGGVGWIQKNENSSDDVLDGGSGSDWLISNGGADLLEGGPGRDFLYAGAHDDMLSGGDGDDVLGGDTRLARGLSPIQGVLSGGTSNVTLGPKIEQETELYGRDTLDGGAGNDLLVGGGGDDVLDGGAGNDQLQGDYIAVGGGDPYGIHGNDVLFGGAGADTLHGGFGDDHLDGSSGNDYLLGGDGDDTYVFGDLWGRDVIRDSAGVDTLLFHTLSGPDELTFSRKGDDLVLSYAAGGSNVRILDAYGSTSSSVENIGFASGVVLDRETFLDAGSFQQGDEAANTLRGFDGASDHLAGGGGADRLIGAGGKDLLEGGPGDDLLQGGQGSDTLMGGPGADRYYVGDGTGDDSLLDESTGDEPNHVLFAPGMVTGDIVGTREGESLVLEWRGRSGSATIQDYFLRPATWEFKLASGTSVELEDLLNPTAMPSGSIAGAWASFEQSKYDELLPKPWRPGNIATDEYTPLDSQISFRPPVALTDLPADVPVELAWSTIFSGPVSWGWRSSPPARQSDSRLEVVTTRGGSGSDDLARASAETYSSETRMGRLVLGDRVALEDGTVLANVSGMVYERDEPVSVEANGPRTQAKVQVRTRRIHKIFGGDGDDEIGAATRSKTYDPLQNQEVWWQSRSAVSLIDGGGGDDWLDGGQGQDFLFGGIGDDQLLGYYGADTLAGGSGYDILQGGEGADSYLAEAADIGFDLIADDGLFSDRALLSYLPQNANSMLRGAEDGSELEILEAVSANHGSDFTHWLSKDRLQVDVSFDSVRVYHAQHEDRPALLLTWGPSEQSGALVLMRGEGDPLGYGIEQFRFADVDLGLNELLSVALVAGAPEIGEFTGDWSVHGLPALAGADTLPEDGEIGAEYDSAEYSDSPEHETGSPGDGGPALLGDPGHGKGIELEGTSNSDYLVGTAEADRLIGRSGRDTLVGGSGNDVLKGGRGDDVILAGTGNDRIAGGTGRDTLHGGEGDDRFRVRGRLGGVDILRGGPGFDSLLGSKGNDIVRMREFGSETSIELIDGGDGYDRIMGTVRQDRLDFSATAVTSMERICTGRGNDTVIGSASNDFIHGGRGSDTLYGGAGDDVIAGGRGMDHLWGGSGDDTFRFGLGSGRDVIHNDVGPETAAAANHADRLVFGRGVSAENLWFERVDEDLRVSILGAGDRLTIEGWYSDSGHGFEGFELSNGRFLGDARVQVLVEAMAGTPAGGSGEIGRRVAIPEDLTTLIGVSWTPTDV